MTISDHTGQKPAAVILRFPRRRGRPRKSIPQRDLGTEELRKKRAMGMTSECLDLCLEKSLITERQHWCGVHLRWLHTLRHGAPGVRAIDPAHLGGKETRSDDYSAWREEREHEYAEAMRVLSASGLANFIASLCIYNEPPAFLQSGAASRSQTHPEVGMLRNGLDILDAQWRKKR